LNDWTAGKGRVVAGHTITTYMGGGQSHARDELDWIELTQVVGLAFAVGFDSS